MMTPWQRSASIALLAAACMGCRPDAAPLPDERELANRLALRDTAFADSTFRLWIEGNDGPNPGDVLYVGQSTRLIGYVVTVGVEPGGKEGVVARHVESARVQWRSLSPRPDGNELSSQFMRLREIVHH